jgi:Ni/Co efflux regulator RcnB
MKSFLAKLIAVSMLCGAMAFAQGTPAAGGKKTDDTKKTDGDKGKGKGKTKGKAKGGDKDKDKDKDKGKGKGKGKGTTPPAKGKTKGGDDKGGKK